MDTTEILSDPDDQHYGHVNPAYTCDTATWDQDIKDSAGFSEEAKRIEEIFRGKRNTFNPEVNIATSEDSYREAGTVTWNHRDHAKPSPLKAYGEIHFISDDDQVAKYVSVDAETDMELLKKLMTEVWSLERPNMLISVTGNAECFTLWKPLKDVFRRGLMKAALTSGAWIVTGGTNTGVKKHAGEAVRDYVLTTEGRVICIGIAPWGCVQKREKLENREEGGNWPASYSTSGQEEPNETFLDPNHSHFILVDNGTRHKFGTEIEFRARLEKEISMMTVNAAHTGTEGAVPVPVCLLVLEGGTETLKQVHTAVENNTPTIVIKGSGEYADILAYAVENVTQEIDSQGNVSVKISANLKSEITEKLKKALDPSRQEDQLELVDRVLQCIHKPHLISIFDPQCEWHSEDSMNLAILKALLKANQNSMSHQLKLALVWNRVDIATSEIFIGNHHKKIKSTELDEILMLAIQLNRVDFVDLLLNNGASFRRFPTGPTSQAPDSQDRLLKLYQEIPRNCVLYECLMTVKSKEEKIALEHVNKVLQKLMGNYLKPYYSVPLTREDETQPRDKPFQDLFVWAVLMNQMDLAKLFWTKGKEATAAALAANSILKSMMVYTTNTVVLQRLQKNADEFENLAIGVINSCYSHDEQKAQDLLIRKMTNWGRATCVLIAVQAHNKRFISQTACQSLLNSIWMGKMSQDNGLIRLFLCIFCFPLILPLIKFKTGEQTENASAQGNPAATERQPTDWEIKAPNSEEGPGLSYYQKICGFYTAPLIISIMNCLSYIAFLLLYSIVLLTMLSREHRVAEVVLTVWVVVIFLEEIRQILSTRSAGFKLVAYIANFWNKLDIVTILSFAVGMTLKFIGEETCLDFARVILAINFASFFVRILQILSVHKKLGPKLVMISRMIRDLMWFMVILMVFICAYVIASEAILYPQTELSWKLLYHLPRKAYWQIYGELFLEDIEGASQCTTDPAKYRNYEEVRCPSSVGKYLMPIMMGVYVLMTNVLLINLLIAMFSYTFQKVQERTNVHWSYQRFRLVQEYYKRPWLPPPFMVFCHVFRISKWLVQGSYSTPPPSKFCKWFSPREERKLIRWENIIARTYMTSLKAQQADSTESRVKDLTNKLEDIQSKLDEKEVQSTVTPPAGADADADAGSERVVPAATPRWGISRPLRVNTRHEVRQNMFWMEQQMRCMNSHMMSTLQNLKSLLNHLEDSEA